MGPFPWSGERVNNAGGGSGSLHVDQNCSVMGWNAMRGQAEPLKGFAVAMRLAFGCVRLLDVRGVVFRTSA